MPIPRMHREIAVQEYGYTLSSIIEATYLEHKAMCLRLATAMGYTEVYLDVPGRRVVGRLKGERVVLADDRDPMNLWCSAWSRLHCEHIMLPWWRRWWVTALERLD